MAGGVRKNSDAALIAALAGGATVARVAEQAGISERTVWWRLQDEGFRQRLDTARQQSVKTAIDALGKAGTAPMTLVSLLAKDNPPSARLGAALSERQTMNGRRPWAG